jgi:1-acyl-sn-glycerol-3-phosphate acyltransferase
MSPWQLLCYRIVKHCSWLMLRVGFGLSVTGQEHLPTHGACIVASNHVSFLDPNVLGASCPRPVRFMARDTLFAHPLLRLYLQAVGVIPLKRGESDPSAVREALRTLRRGECLALFPEGTRQLSGELGRARRGVGLLACLAKVPIVPALVQGTHEALPPEGGGLKRAKIRIAFGKPIAYTDVPSATDAHAARERHRVLADLVTQAWQRLKAERHGQDRTTRATPV